MSSEASTVSPVSSAAADKTFLLGTGCQKGGTTWLFHYLKESPQYVAGYRKEYHVLDALHVPAMEYRKKEVVAAAEASLTRARRGGPINAQPLHLASMYADPEIYFDYFTGLLNSRDDGRVTADVTPSYGMLPAEVLSGVKKSFADRGVRTVAVFLMRDPVDRILSHIRMQVRHNPQKFEKEPHELMLERHTHPQYRLRTSYDETIAALDRAFGDDERYYGFYESLFDVERIREICALLRIDFHPPKLDERKNASPPADAPESTQRVVAEHYRGVYEAVASRFPDVDLEALWPSTRLLS